MKIEIELRLGLELFSTGAWEVLNQVRAGFNKGFELLQWNAPKVVRVLSVVGNDRRPMSPVEEDGG